MEDLTTIILGGGQLTLIILTARLAYIFGSLSEKVDNLVNNLGDSKRIIENLLDQNDDLRDRMKGVEVKLNEHMKLDT